MWGTVFGTDGTAYRANHARAETWHHHIIRKGVHVQHCLMIALLDETALHLIKIQLLLV